MLTLHLALRSMLHFLSKIPWRHSALTIVAHLPPAPSIFSSFIKPHCSSVRLTAALGVTHSTEYSLNSKSRTSPISLSIRRLHTVPKALEQRKRLQSRECTERRHAMLVLRCTARILNKVKAHHSLIPSSLAVTLL